LPLIRNKNTVAVKPSEKARSATATNTGHTCARNTRRRHPRGEAVHSGSERRGELAALAARTSAYGGSPACVFVCACQLLSGSPQPKNKLGSTTHMSSCL
jgi:hypothetical protein